MHSFLKQYLNRILYICYQHYYTTFPQSHCQDLCYVQLILVSKSTYSDILMRKLWCKQCCIWELIFLFIADFFVLILVVYFFLCCFFFHYVSARFHLWPSSGDFTATSDRNERRNNTKKQNKKKKLPRWGQKKSAINKKINSQIKKPHLKMIQLKTMLYLFCLFFLDF